MLTGKRCILTTKSTKLQGLQVSRTQASKHLIAAMLHSKCTNSYYACLCTNPPASKMAANQTHWPALFWCLHTSVCIYWNPYHNVPFIIMRLWAANVDLTGCQCWFDWHLFLRWHASLFPLHDEFHTVCIVDNLQCLTKIIVISVNATSPPCFSRVCFCRMTGTGRCVLWRHWKLPLDPLHYHISSVPSSD